MKYVESENTPSETIASKAWLLGGIAFLLCVGGCGGGAKNSGTSPTAPQQGPQTYFAPYVSATTNGGGGSTVLRVPQTYAIDDHADTFTQAVFGLPATKGPQVLTAGCFLSQALCTPNVVPAGQRGLLSLGITTTYANTGSAYVPTTINPAKPGSFAVELAGQAGGLVQLVGQPVAPLAASAQCPTSTTTQTWQFVTLPGALIDSAQSGSQWSTWDPTAETAYGSIDISSDGTNVSFGNIHQFTLPSVGGTGVPSQPPPSSIAGNLRPVCLWEYDHRPRAGRHPRSRNKYCATASGHDWDWADRITRRRQWRHTYRREYRSIRKYYGCRNRGRRSTKADKRAQPNYACGGTISWLRLWSRILLWKCLISCHWLVVASRIFRLLEHAAGLCCGRRQYEHDDLRWGFHER